VEPPSQAASGILNIAPRLVCPALNLIELAFGFQAIIAYQGAGGLLDAASYFL
jgi:hypothetical protein